MGLGIDKERTARQSRLIPRGLRVVFGAFIFMSMFWGAFACKKDGNVNLLTSAKTLDMAGLKNLVENGADPNYQDGDGKTILHLLGINFLGKDEADAMVHYLVQQGARIDAADKSGNAPLFDAILGGNLDLAVSLVHHGADVNFQNPRGQTPLFMAVSLITAGPRQTRGLDMARFLQQAGGNIFARDNDGKNLIHYSKDPETTAWLIEQGQSPALRDNFGKTPLDYNRDEILKLRDSIAADYKAKKQGTF